MKKYLITLILISTFNFAFCQNDIKDVPKMTTKIIVSNVKTGIENYQFVLNSLLDNDFGIDNKDSDLLIIKTEVKPAKDTGSYYLSLRCKDNLIEVKGYFKMGMTLKFGGVNLEDDFDEIVNRGMKGSLYKNIFTEMFEFSKLLGEDLTFKQ